MRSKAISAGELPGAPTHQRPATTLEAGVVEQQTALVRHLIWLYIVLWLIEGGLRRWFLPGLASPLLLIRDPLVIAIYCLAASYNLFPINGFITWGALLGALSFVNALLLGHGNIFVALYGVRCDFLHVPLIFVMGKVLRQKDVLALAKVALWVSVPYTALLVAQFYQPQDAWVNRGVGGSLEGAGFDGALDRFRPPGTFSFITGPSQLYPLFTACWFALLLARKLPIWTMIASGGAILVTIPISISRTLFLCVAIVAAAGVGAMLAGGRFSMKLVIQFVLVAAILYVSAGHSLVFKDGMEAFSARWETATTDQGGFQEAIVDRMVNDLFGYLGGVNGYGKGTGFSTNVGQKSLTAELGFGGSEGEWGRLLYDNGFALGSMLIVYRIALAFAIVIASFRAWQRRSTLSVVFAAATFQTLLHGHWGQTTTLGSAAIGGGLGTGLRIHARDRHFKKPRETLTGQPCCLELLEKFAQPALSRTCMKMRLIFLTHPPSFASVSMPRFAGMIMRGMLERGHEVEAWTSRPRIGHLPIRSPYIRKWLRYIDQFLLYPLTLQKLVNQQPGSTLFVITDQALGMWVPCLAYRPHIIHCHDFLALKSALGAFPENSTGWSGRQYQKLIRRGFSRGKAFISVSRKTRDDLHGFLPTVPKISEVVHNGLNHPFRPMNPDERIPLLKKTSVGISAEGFIIHISGNQWYKNPKGVLAIYRAYATTCPKPSALWMVGAKPTAQLLYLAASIPSPGKVHFLSTLTNEQVNAAYSHARVLLFPSLEEGFGWPVVEAMASGCPVLTTNRAPMTEMAGETAWLIPRMPANETEQRTWAMSAAKILDEIVRLNESRRTAILNLGKLNAARFDAETAIAAYERIYSQVIAG